METIKLSIRVIFLILKRLSLLGLKRLLGHFTKNRNIYKLYNEKYTNIKKMKTQDNIIIRNLLWDILWRAVDVVAMPSILYEVKGLALTSRLGMKLQDIGAC